MTTQSAKIQYMGRTWIDTANGLKDAWEYIQIGQTEAMRGYCHWTEDPYIATGYMDTEFTKEAYEEFEAPKLAQKIAILLAN